MVDEIKRLRLTNDALRRELDTVKMSIRKAADSILGPTCEVPDDTFTQSRRY